MSDELPTFIGPDLEEIAVPFGQVVGENVQRIRADLGMSQSVLARLLSTSGERWTKSNVAALERGARARVGDGELAQLAGTLGVLVADLYQGDGYLSLGNGAVISREDWRKALMGHESPTLSTSDPDAVAPYASGRPDFVAVEIADRLDTSIHSVIRAARELYGRTATAEHAARVGELDDPASQSAAVKRGNVTRQLVAEVEKKIRKRADEQ